MKAALKAGAVRAGIGLQRHLTAVVVLGLWMAVSVKQFWFTPAPDASLLAPSYETITQWSVLLVAAVLGLRGVQQMLGKS